MRPQRAIVFLLVLVISACAREEAPASASVPVTAPAVDVAPATPDGAEASVPAIAAEHEAELPAMPTGDFRITALALGKAVDAEGQVRQPLEVFGTNDRIFAAVTSVGTSDGLMLEARWTAADGSEVAKAGQSLSPSSPTITTFSIAHAEPWPAGDYQIALSINGRVVETRNFLVQ